MIFHVDNLILAHIRSNAVTKRIKILDKVHGTKDLLVVTGEKTHKHLEIALTLD